LSMMAITAGRGEKIQILVIFSNGHKVDQIVGAVPESTIKSMIEGLL
jgi:thioredoxin-like negative regulator of GroEL